MYTLVVVDMQASFKATRKEYVRENCKREIIRAMDYGAAIIFVEYVGSGPTIPSLVKLTDDYERTFVTRKNSNDGSREVTNTIRNRKLASKRVKVCGVNTDYCVLETVSGLTRKLRDASLEVIADACNSSFNHLAGLHNISKMSNVSIKSPNRG